MSAEPWPTDAERAAVVKCVRNGNRLIAALAPHVAQRERDAAARWWAVGWRAGTTGATPTVNPYRDEVTS